MKYKIDGKKRNILISLNIKSAYLQNGLRHTDLFFWKFSLTIIKCNKSFKEEVKITL